MCTSGTTAGPTSPKSRSNTRKTTAILLAVLFFSGPVLAGESSPRIVPLNSDALEVLRILDAQDLVAGVISGLDRDPEFWGELVKRPSVGRWSDPDIEAIVALRPDYVIAYSRNPSKDLERKLAPFGIQVLRLDFYKAKTLADEVRFLGRVTGHEARAEKFCSWYEENLGLIERRLASTTSRPPVYIENYADYHADGPGSGGDEIATLAGGTNIANVFAIPYPRVTPEWVISRRPGVIFKAMSCERGYCLTDSSPYDSKRDSVMKRPAWEHVPAVEKGDVYVVESAVFSGPRLIVGMSLMARAIHPALFDDLDPWALHARYLETFQGVPARGVYMSGEEM